MGGESSTAANSNPDPSAASSQPTAPPPVAATSALASSPAPPEDNLNKENVSPTKSDSKPNQIKETKNDPLVQLNRSVVLPESLRDPTKPAINTVRERLRLAQHKRSEQYTQDVFQKHSAKSDQRPDGKIEIEEGRLEAALLDLGIAGDVHKRFAEIDMDKSGTVNYEEFKAPSQYIYV
jgi:hypothetical protein